MGYEPYLLFGILVCILVMIGTCGLFRELTEQRQKTFKVEADFEKLKLLNKLKVDWDGL